MSSKIKKQNSFQINQKIFCPWHGLGTIISIEEKMPDQKFYKIRYLKENLSSFVPIAKVKEFGLRDLSTKDIINRMFCVLEKPFRIGKGMWSKRAQEYDTKMSSGSILLTTEIVRDLFITSKDPNRSYSERVIYETALSRVVSEAAIVLGLSENDIESKIITILSKSMSPTVKDAPKNQVDDFKDDLESFSDDYDSDSS
ncbi:MAG: hypothetical protein JJW01_03155 [Alphaproteobacteria bacterium]|nr:hypothetical protein [Rickettsiales bacterium]